MTFDEWYGERNCLDISKSYWQERHFMHDKSVFAHGGLTHSVIYTSQKDAWEAALRSAATDEGAKKP